MNVDTTVVPGNDRRGEWAVVLGASSGMGREVSKHLARQGMNILGVHMDTAVRAAEVEQAYTDISAHGTTVTFVNANAAAQSSRSEVIQTLQGQGQVGVLFHSLAFGSLLPYLPAGENTDEELLTPKQMTMTLEVMAHSLVWWTRDLIAADLLPSGSHVLAMTSAGDSRVSRSYGAVSAAKSALLAHVRQLAVEAARHNVAVNAIRAGVTMTPSFERIPGSDRLSQVALAANPHGRLTTPSDVADAVVTLTGSRSAWLTGNVISVDGGEGLTT